MLQTECKSLWPGALLCMAVMLHRLQTSDWRPLPCSLQIMLLCCQWRSLAVLPTANHSMVPRTAVARHTPLCTHPMLLNLLASYGRRCTAQTYRTRPRVAGFAACQAAKPPPSWAAPVCIDAARVRVQSGYRLRIHTRAYFSTPMMPCKVRSFGCCLGFDAASSSCKTRSSSSYSRGASGSWP